MTDIITNSGINVVLNRAYKASPDYTAPSKFKIGTNNGTPVAADTVLDYPIPIENGTINDDGDNQFTGTSAGTNTTDNTTTFKPGGGVTDDTSQNLIKDNSSIAAYWTSPVLATNGINMVGTQPYGCWVYIKDTAAFNKFRVGSPCLYCYFRTNGDGDGLNYVENFTTLKLSVGWNWISSSTTNVEDLTSEGGGPSGTLNEFRIGIATVNATDTFAAGDVIYDLLRQWSPSDLIQDFVTDYPMFDEPNKTVTIRCFLTSVQANGFLINATSLENTDATPLVTDISSFDEESKSDTEEFAFVFENKLE